MAICDIITFISESVSTDYADDKVQTTSGTCLSHVIQIAEYDANNTVRFFKLNKFSIQPSKTSLIVIKPKKDKRGEMIKINVDGNIIQEQQSFKMLGFYIDNKLSNETHVENVVKKARKT